ncbi:hypothetical protein D9615_003359 [Tricholomella constricta]|uniref:O-methyltransferase domain-containing protein n=1 Tax=Tricholomella constricta TaxID=117010 RepID=A0A8H5M810_9AGAR|nr:hypothetical protein D9615_003359 [Tricholomella constricta]
MCLIAHLRTHIHSTRMASPLRALADIISANVSILEAAYAKEGAQFPSLDDPFHRTPLDTHPLLSDTKQLIAAAAAQMVATVRSPVDMLQEYSNGMYMTVTLGLVVDVNVPDILTTAGHQGLHVNDISAQNGIDPSYLARVLRFLATRHVFREVSPDVFANNRVSSLLKKAKSLEEVIADPVARYDGAALASFISAYADEALKSSVHLSEFVQNPERACSAFSIAHQTEAKMWDWYEDPRNELRARRFAAAMKGGADRFPAEIFINAIGCEHLQDNDVVVDVGGSVGAAVLHLYKPYPKLRYVVQDLEKQIVVAKEFWKENAPEAVANGRVELQVYDFFTPQPVKGAAVYFHRVNIHNWPDHDAKKIMQIIRDAANASSKVVLFDIIAAHVCEDPVSELSTARKKVPYPLLPNLGVAGAGIHTAMDIQPHVHPSSAVKAPREALKQVPYKKTRPISIPPYISPFSPTSYMRSAWLVPIRGAFSWDRCTPAVMLDFSHAIPASSNPSTGDPISWTHSSVKSFWAFLLHVRENGTAGAIGLSFHASRNGTRMSQVINTVSSTLPGAEYQQDSAHSVATGAVSIATTAPPPRIVLSNVDHVKVYHDASIAMHLRNILHLWSYAVPTEIQSQALTKIRVLKGAKLVLVDERSRGILIS